MNNPARPPSPVINDVLYKALNPLPQVLDDRQRVKQIMKKYGQEVPKVKSQPTRQWVGDNQA